MCIRDREYTAFHCFSTDYQFCGFVYRSSGLTGGYDASLDRHADVVGEPDYLSLIHILMPSQKVEIFFSCTS